MPPHLAFLGGSWDSNSGLMLVLESIFSDGAPFRLHSWWHLMLGASSYVSWFNGVECELEENTTGMLTRALRMCCSFLVFDFLWFWDAVVVGQLFNITENNNNLYPHLTTCSNHCQTALILPPPVWDSSIHKLQNFSLAWVSLLIGVTFTMFILPVNFKYLDLTKWPAEIPCLHSGVDFDYIGRPYLSCLVECRWN